MKNKAIKKKPKATKTKLAQKKKAHLREKFIRIPGIDKGKVIIKPDFDAPLHEFDAYDPRRDMQHAQRGLG